MTSSSHIFPVPLRHLLSRLPAYPGNVLFSTALSFGLMRLLPADVRDSLQGKRLRIDVRDAGIAFDFQLSGERFVACQPGGKPDLTIAAGAYDFWLLAQKKEDPDTLFFSRRLLMEGDTDLGLLVKNTLDAIDRPLSELLPMPVHVAGVALRNRRHGQ